MLVMVGVWKWNSNNNAIQDETHVKICKWFATTIVIATVTVAKFNYLKIFFVTIW
jgi:hypothetical protein